MRTLLSVLSLLLGIAVLAVIACWAVPVRAQEHDHGNGHIPDWYDPSCCNQRDCKPVADEDIEFLESAQVGTVIGPAVRYKPTGNLFLQHQWRRSQDERYHVCILPSGNSACFYDRLGV